MSEDDLLDRFPDDEGTGETGETDTTGQTGHTEETGQTSGTRTRSRSQYPMYLSERLQDELDETYERERAERTLDGREAIEKHSDFLEAVVWEGLESDWEERLE